MTNGIILDGDVIEFQRETYPFLFNHQGTDLLGEVKRLLMQNKRLISAKSQYIQLSKILSKPSKRCL